MNIVEACLHPKLFRHFLDKGGDLSSWKPWLTFLRVLYGLPIPDFPPARLDLIRQCTGRDASTFKSGFDAGLVVMGRRGGKSKLSAIIGAYEATMAGHEKDLDPGEPGVVAIVSPTREQSKIVTNYLRAIFKIPALRSLVVNETKDEIELSNRISIKILTGSFRQVRGHTICCCIADELAFFMAEEDGKIQTDTALVQAIMPALATTPHSKFLGITTPYARKGYVFQQYQRHFGNPTSDFLVWNCPSKTMNPTLDDRIIKRAYQEDLAAAKSEWGGEFRDDVSAFISREAVEKLIVPGRSYQFPTQGFRYKAFADHSGGRKDDSVLAIGHREGRLYVLDFLRRIRPPFDPSKAIDHFVEELRRFGVRKVTGDQYGADFVCRRYQDHQIKYKASEKNKSQLYTELLPVIYSGQLELLDDKTLVDQISSLESRTRAGGKTIIDHPPNQHDDVANAVAGLVVELATTRLAGVIPLEQFLGLEPSHAGAW